MTDEWNDEHRRRVRSYYAMFIGTICVLMGGGLLLWDQMHTAESTTIELLVAGGIVLLGLCASMPQTFMPIISNLIERLPGGEKINKPFENSLHVETIIENTIKRALEQLSESEEKNSDETE